MDISLAREHRGVISRCIFTLDGERMLTASSDGNCHLFRRGGGGGGGASKVSFAGCDGKEGESLHLKVRAACIACGCSHKAWNHQG